MLRFVGLALALSLTAAPVLAQDAAVPPAAATATGALAAGQAFLATNAKAPGDRKSVV